MNRFTMILLVVTHMACTREKQAVQKPQPEMQHPTSDMCWTECMNRRLEVEEARKEKIRKAAEAAYTERVKYEREQAAKNPHPIRPAIPEKLYDQTPPPVIMVEDARPVSIPGR